MPKYLLTFAFLLALIDLAPAQRMLLLERAGSPRPQKIFAGTVLEYKVRGDDYWSRGEVQDFVEERQLLVFDDRYVAVGDIAYLRFRRGFARPLALSLQTFGLGWSFFAAVGYTFDGNPETHYSWGDAIVTASSLGLGFLIQQAFQTRRIKMSERRRLRIVDVNF